MDFHWTDERHIIPIWKKKLEVFPTLIIPSSQKNRRVQEIPLLPGLIELLESVPIKNRVGWVVDPQPMEFVIQSDSEWFKPDDATLIELAMRFSNVAIGRACGVSETSVRHWLIAAGIERTASPTERGDISAKETRQLRKRSECRKAFTGQRKSERMTVERVGRVIGLIGKAANIFVRQADPRTETEDKYASAHDLRRGFAQRMINLGVTAETLKQLLRHASFSTTQNYYGATRSAQVAGHEVRDRLSASNPA